MPRKGALNGAFVRCSVQSVFLRKTLEYLSGNDHAPVSIPFPLVIILPQFAFQELSS
jgi:hypothetical protein